MINVIPSTASWTTYLNYFTNYQTLSSFDSFIQLFLPYYHYSTGLSSVLIYSLIKASGVSSNSAAMSTSSTDAQHTAGRNSYVGYVGTGIWLGSFLGSFLIIPTTILGILTLPFNLPIWIWKTVDQCSYTNANFISCVWSVLPWLDMYGITYIAPTNMAL